MKLTFPLTTDLLTVVSFWIKSLRQSLQKSCEITIPQFRVLSCLEQQQKNLRLNELAEMIELSSSTATYVVDKLEESGYLRRNSNAHNRRVIELELLPEGSRVAKEGYAISTKLNETLMQPLGPFLKKVAARGLEGYEENYIFLAKSHKYLIDGTALNALVLYENKMSEVLRELALSNNEFRVLFELEQNPQGARVSALARKMLSKTSDVTVACNKLESSGYIFRQQSLQDRRAIDVAISAKGCDKIWEAAPRVDAIFLQAACGASEEERNMELKASSIVAAYQRKSFVCS